MKSYQIGDMVLLRRTPHQGTSYPIDLLEAAEKGIPLMIEGYGNTTYWTKVNGLAYGIFEDEIIGLRKWVALFI